MSSLLSETFLQSGFGLTLKSNGLSNHRRDFFLSPRYSGGVVSLCLRNDFGSLSVSLLSRFNLNELGLGNDLIVLKISLSIDLIDECIRVSPIFTLEPRSFGLDALNLLLHFHLPQLSLFHLVLPFLPSLLLFLLDLLPVVSKPLVISKPLPLKGGLELINSGILHIVRNILVQNHRCDDHSLDQDTFVIQILIQVSGDALSVIRPPQVVSLFGLHGSCHHPHPFHEVGLDQLVHLRNVGAK